MQPDDAMRLITALRGRGFTVEINGTGEAWVEIRTDESDLIFAAGAPSTEEALRLAAQQLYAYLAETVVVLLPYVTHEKPHETV